METEEITNYNWVRIIRLRTPTKITWIAHFKLGRLSSPKVWEHRTFR